MRRETVEFNGGRFHRYPESPSPCHRNYYLGYTNGVRKYLHRAIWEAHNGPIPEGYEVHHIDHDTLNNDPGNLVAVPRSWHRAESANARLDRERTCSHCGIAFTGKSGSRYTSDRWFCSNRCNLAWRRAAGLDRGEVVCVECGRRVESINFRRQRYCGARCASIVRARQRTPSAVACTICGRSFETLQPQRSKYCAPPCAKAGREGRRLARIAG